MKRVVCFYRVSSKKQLIENDIPMQRNACMDFVLKKPDWEYAGEYIEKGVSGFKVKASCREKLEELKEDALKGKYDIILCFMFDRLGRIEEETPFVLKWFVEQGIEMWSVKEGQRVLDNHTDNLLNYITFWQASGESKKTQQRTLEAKKQMAEAGKFLGGPAPYGYKHESTGEHNEKGREIKKLVIDEKEAEVVRKIFYLSTRKGYGARRIAKFLNETKTPTKKGGEYQWSGTTITGILKNSIYKGYYTYGRYKAINGKRIYCNQSNCCCSKIKQEDMVIISEAKWQEAQTLIASRTGTMNNKNHLPRQTKSLLLLSGIVYCAACGSKMTLHYSYQHGSRKAGSTSAIRKTYYVCNAKVNGQKECKSRYYPSDRVEGAVLEVLHKYLEQLGKIDINKYTNQIIMEQNKKNQQKLKKLKEEILVLKNDLLLCKEEVRKILNSESTFTKDLIQEIIRDTKSNLKKKSSEFTQLQFLLKNQTELFYHTQKETVLDSRELFDSMDIEMKKMILTKIIDTVSINDKEIQLNLKMQLTDFLTVETMNDPKEKM